LPNVLVILTLIRVTYQFANNVLKKIYFIELINPQTKMVSFWQLQNPGFSA
jgi:hypothetical protein